MVEIFIFLVLWVSKIRNNFKNKKKLKKNENVYPKPFFNIICIVFFFAGIHL